MSPPVPRSITIRRAIADDADAIAAVHVQTWQASYAGLLPAPMLDALSVETRATLWRRILVEGDAHQAAIHLAWSGDALLGFASDGIVRDDALRGFGAAGEISALYVAPDQQRRGIGRRLFTAARADLADRGLTPLALWTFRDNPSSCGFYARENGTVLGTRVGSRGGLDLVEIAFGWP